jgi:hypothetical protein
MSANDDDEARGRSLVVFQKPKDTLNFASANNVLAGGYSAKSKGKGRQLVCLRG